ncbi:DnaJ-domain-containing protein, partial [Aureobasidium melanogenum]
LGRRARHKVIRVCRRHSNNTSIRTSFLHNCIFLHPTFEFRRVNGYMNSNLNRSNRVRMPIWCWRSTRGLGFHSSRGNLRCVLGFSYCEQIARYQRCGNGTRGRGQNTRDTSLDVCGCDGGCNGYCCRCSHCKTEISLVGDGRAVAVASRCRLLFLVCRQELKVMFCKKCLVRLCSFLMKSRILHWRYHSGTQKTPGLVRRERSIRCSRKASLEPREAAAKSNVDRILIEGYGKYSEGQTRIMHRRTTKVCKSLYSYLTRQTKPFPANEETNRQGDLSFFLTFAVWTRRAEEVDDRKLAHVVMGKGGKVEVEPSKPRRDQMTKRTRKGRSYQIFGTVWLPDAVDPRESSTASTRRFYVPGGWPSLLYATIRIPCPPMPLTSWSFSLRSSQKLPLEVHLIVEEVFASGFVAFVDLFLACGLLSVFLCFFGFFVCFCDATINAFLRFLSELGVGGNLFLLNGLVDDVAETVLVNSRIADHDLLVDLVHVSLVLCVGGEQGIAFFITALIFLGERNDGVFGNGICELGAIEVVPVENVVVYVERLVGAAGVVVASAAAFVTEDGVGEGDFLEFGMGGILVFGLCLVLFESECGLAVSSLDLVLGGSFFNTENLVGLDSWRFIEYKDRSTGDA